MSRPVECLRITMLLTTTLSISIHQFTGQHRTKNTMYTPRHTKTDMFTGLRKHGQHGKVSTQTVVIFKPLTASRQILIQNPFYIRGSGAVPPVVLSDEMVGDSHEMPLAAIIMICGRDGIGSCSNGVHRLALQWRRHGRVGRCRCRRCQRCGLAFGDSSPSQAGLERCRCRLTLSVKLAARHFIASSLLINQSIRQYEQRPSIHSIVLLG